MSEHKKYIQIFEQYGYVLNFKFRHLSKNRILYASKKKEQFTYVITEVYPANCSKNKEKSKSTVILVSKLNIEENEYKICNSNLQSALERIIRKLDKSNKISLNIAQKFKLYLFYPTVFRKYYKDIFTPIILICFAIFLIIMGILEAQATVHWEQEIFGI